MGKKGVKKLLAVIMIITILATDFYVLGSNLITYATQVTNEIQGYSNIHFSTYFKEGENEVKEITKTIKDKEIKLYAKIGVNSDVDYLEDIEMKLADNFKIISSNKGRVENNTVKLDYIASLAEIELNIEPNFSDKISADMQLKTNIELNAKYKYADEPEGKNIKVVSEAVVKYQPNEETKAQVATDIITNKATIVNGENKRVIQALIRSRLAENSFPVKQTVLNVSIPQLSEEVPEISALVVGKLSTNGTTQINNMTAKNGNIEITLNNEADENNQVSWNRNCYDEIIITYIYPETADASKVEITANSEIKLHASQNTYTAESTKEIENKELMNVVMKRTKLTTEEMYKGQLYANIDTPYSTKTSIIITNADMVNNIATSETEDKLGTTEGDLEANTKYVTTKINLEKMLEIFGQDGEITIINGENTTIVDKNFTVDAEGNVVINYENSARKIDIKTTKPVKAGVLEIDHTKAITGDTLTRKQLKTVNALKVTGISTELKETISKAELTVDRTTLSATEENEITLGIKLITDGPKYDLYKNPSITIKLPEVVQNAEIIDEPSKLYADELKITNQNYNSLNHTLTIDMEGEQTAYPESSVTQGYIQIKLKVKLLRYILSNTSKIVMEYTNENASQYENGTTCGVVEQPIEISAPSELLKTFNLSLDLNSSFTEKVLHQVKKEDANKQFGFTILLMNHKDADMKNIKILGKLATTGNTIEEGSTNTLETTLKSITPQNANATVYYTENSNATADIEDAKNGWTQTLLPNAKMYLIKLDTLARGENYTALVTEQFPSEIPENAISYAQYDVIYDIETKIGQTESSREIALATSKTASIKVDTVAQVGADILENGDAVKEGEVIQYIVNVKNNGTETLKNVKLKLDIPEGTKYVRPIKQYIDDGEVIKESGGYVYADSYYEEITDSTELSRLTSITIPELTTVNEFAIKYEVRVNKGTAGKEISNKSVITYEDSTIESAEIKNKVEEANIRVSIKRGDDLDIDWIQGGEAKFIVHVENLSNSSIKNLELELMAKGFNINATDGASTKIKIDEIKPKDDEAQEDKDNGMRTLIIYGEIDKDIEEISIRAIVRDSEEKIYRSNVVTEDGIENKENTINMTSPQNGKYIKEGDTVEYNIIVKNTCDSATYTTIYYTLPRYFEIQAIYENKELKLEKTTNDIIYGLHIESQEEVQVNIIAKVGYIPELYHGKTITNMAKINVEDVLEVSSQPVTHILKANGVEDQKIENIISGIAWLDTNSNGKRESNEETLSKIVVKLYDKTANQYVTDENGTPIETMTDANGEYTFKGIANGSYLIIFEYDTSKYEFSKGTDSIAELKYININGQQVRVTAIEVNVNENTFSMNIGLKQNSGNTPQDQQPGTDTKPENPNTPNTPDTPGNTEKPNEENQLKTISGLAWLDSNRNGKKETDEELLSGIKVKLYDVTKQKYVTETTTDENGKYIFNDIEKGSYILIFEYNKEEYEPTTYMAQGVDSANSSKAIINKININGQEITAAVTDTIKLQENISNINIGLKENLIFDLELNKYISKIVVQTNKKTKTYEYENKTLVKTEIHRKQIQGALVVIEYTIKVKNNGEISGYAKNIVDYLPSGLTFSSELNSDWYLSDGCLYTKALENIQIQPGEEKEIKLILTKTMTNNNVGLINNRAEIYQDYNKFGRKDIDSTPNNQVQGEDDFSSVDVIIQVATGGGNIATAIIMVTINVILIGLAINLMTKKQINKLPNRKWRG